MDFATRRSQSSSILTYNLVRSGWLLLRALSGSPLGPARQVVARDDLTGDLLKRVSRSFYLSLAILPRSVRGPVGLAYLLAQTADSIMNQPEVMIPFASDKFDAFREELCE